MQQLGSHAVGYAALAFLAGVGIPILASLNANLGARLANPVAATVVLFLVGLAVSAAALTVVGVPKASAFSQSPPVYYLGGVLVAFYILTVTWVVPRFGLSNAIFFVLLGQIVAAALIDHFGIFGATRAVLTIPRVTGIVVMTAGLLLAVRST